MDVWELSAREAIRELVARYAHGVDSGSFDEVAALFVPDGTLEVVGGDRAVGRDAIRAFLAGVRGDREARAERAAAPLGYLRHHVSNVLVELEGRAAASVRAYFFVVTDRGPDHWGRYRDRVVHDGAHWRLAHRRARIDGVAPGSWAAERTT